MRLVLIRAAVLASGVFATFLVADVLSWGAYQGLHPRDQLGSQLAVHGAVHLAVLLLSFAGAAASFFALRNRLPSIKAAALFGVAFAVASFFALPATTAIAGMLAGAAWLLAGSAVAAIASGVLAGAQRG